MSDQQLITRIRTAVILSTVISLAVSAGAWSFFILLCVINVLSLREFYRLFVAAGVYPQQITGLIASVSLLTTFTGSAAATIHSQWLLINIPVLISVYFAELFRKKTQPFTNIAFTFLAIIFITLPLCFLGSIAFLLPGEESYNSLLILFYFILIWTSDTAAYFSGKLFGRHALFKRISPHKTWEGFIGALLACGVAALIASWYVHTLALWKWALIALAIVTTGTLGDLSKSLMKRSLNIKDSGTMLPGHGGMLDRFDSLFGSAPFVFAVLKLFPDT